MRRKIRTAILLIILVALLYGIVYAYRAMPIISGFGAKAVCSCVFNSGRTAEDVIQKELSPFPLSIGTFILNLKDSSASGSVFGLAKRKAIYRKGLGCTLLNELSEHAVRSQQIQLASKPIILQDSLPWPMGNQLADTIAPNVDITQLHNAVDEAFVEPSDKPLRRTRAVIVLYGGKIVAEKYADGFTANTPHTGWSMTKSITNALVGILIKQGKLQLNNKQLFDEWKNDDRKNISLNNLLHANSGLDWQEVYTGPSPATNMLYKKDDMAAYVKTFKKDEEPEKHFKYSSGTTNMISNLIRQKTGEAYYRFPYEQLFYKLGMYSAVMEPDASGTFVGSSYCFASPRDWARFGLLYLNDGIANGERILPEGWVKYTTTPVKGASMGEYGAQFWLNAGAPGNPSNRRYPGVPTDCFYADGYEGQFVWIVPSKKLVVVKLGLQHGNELDENRFLADVIKSIK